jgi:hypothetical protein
MKIGVSENSFKKAATKLGCEVAMIKAVDAKESKGGGFLPNGDVKILFEPHIFWKYLRMAGITPVLSDICYPRWGTKPYGKESQQHTKLQRAVRISRNIALMSASWGRFQIMGFNFKACGCKNIQEFVNKMMESEESQLELFVNYILSSYLDDELQELDFQGFGLGYNGPLYFKHEYHTKLKNLYLQFKKEA